MAWLKGLALAVLIAAAVVAALPLDAVADSSFIPLPVYATSPNEGNTYGFLPVWLLKDQSEYVYGIVAPSVLYNGSTGVNFTFRYLGYPTIDRNYRIYLNQSTKVDQEYTVEYEDTKFLDGKFRLHAMCSFDKDSTMRFFGLTEKSEGGDETNYMEVKFVPRFTLGWKRRPPL